MQPKIDLKITPLLVEVDGKDVKRQRTFNLWRLQALQPDDSLMGNSQPLCVKYKPKEWEHFYELQKTVEALGLTETNTMYAFKRMKKNKISPCLQKHLFLSSQFEIIMDLIEKCQCSHPPTGTKMLFPLVLIVTNPRYDHAGKLQPKVDELRQYLHNAIKDILRSNEMIAKIRAADFNPDPLTTILVVIYHVCKFYKVYLPPVAKQWKCANHETHLLYRALVTDKSLNKFDYDQLVAMLKSLS